MRIFQTRYFTKFARKNGLSVEQLLDAVERLEAGSFDASLGSGLYKQRVARKGAGKSSGFRTLVYRSVDRAIFVAGFAKNVQTNLSEDELDGLRALSKRLLAYTKSELDQAVATGKFQELR